MVKYIASEQAKFVLGIVATNRQFPYAHQLVIASRMRIECLFTSKIRINGRTKSLRHLGIDGRRVLELSVVIEDISEFISALEINLVASLAFTNDSLVVHSSLSRIQVTLNNLLPDLESLLESTPNIKRLHLRGELTSNVVEQFERMAHLFMHLTSHLVKFDCQLVCYISDKNGYESVIREIHPLFRNVRYLIGPDKNRCYTTDTNVYAGGNEFQRKYDRNHRCVGKRFKYLQNIDSVLSIPH